MSLNCPFSESTVAVLNLRRADELGRIDVVCTRPHRLAMPVRPLVGRLRVPTPDPLHDIGRPANSKMHRASLRPLLQHLHPPRQTNFDRCFSQLCSLWRRFGSDLETLDTGIELLLRRRVLIEILLQLGPFAAFATAVDEIPADGAF